MTVRWVLLVVGLTLGPVWACVVGWALGQWLADRLGLTR